MKALLVAAALAPLLAQEPLETSVGMPARVRELVLPGPELEVLPPAPDDPLVLRVVEVRPHGTAHRYTLEAWAYEPGEYDLAAHLRRVDGAPLDVDLPAVPLRVASLLPPGQVQPSAPPPKELPALGGYRLLAIAAGALWLVGLVAILLVGRRKRRDQEQQLARPRSLAERLRPLVERAAAGQLSGRERAELELSLVAWWRRRLGLERERPEAALATLRAHEQAGPLLRGLEEWLHHPAPAREVDVAALLAPYRDLPPDELERAEAAGSAARS